MPRFSTPVSSFPSRATAVVGVALLLVAFTACDSGGGDPAENSPMEVGFTTTTTAGMTSTDQGRKSASDSMIVRGPNGTLTLTDIRFVVGPLELETEDDSLSATVPPAVVDVPLDTTGVDSAGTFGVPPGTYVKFEFETVDLDPEGDDSLDTAPELQALLSQIRNEFPNWPADASMVAVGRFTPSGGTPRSFTTFLEAEIEIERPLAPPLEVRGEGTARSLTVRLDPSLWFLTSGGQVLDLSQYQSTDTLLEIEDKFENGVLDVETGAPE